MSDAISWVRVSACTLPLATPISDARVLTGRQKPMTEIAPVLLGEDPNDIAKLWDKLCWAGASVGRSGLSVQAIGAFDVALWDLKAKRAGLSLAKLLGTHRDSVRCYNTSGGFFAHTTGSALRQRFGLGGQRHRRYQAQSGSARL